jgi:RHS repeat-associated protein
MLALYTNGTSNLFSVFYMHADRLGTPQYVTDSTKAVVWKDLYQPFGADSPTFIGNVFLQNLRFPGQQYDAETGLYHNGQREYDTTKGRYIQTDPIGLNGGINTYAYAGNNPFRFTDPSGLAAGTAPFIGPVQPGKLNLFPPFVPNDPTWTYFNLMPSIPNIFQVGAHGNPLDVVDPNTGLPLTAQQLAQLMYDAGYSQGEPVWLQACETGKNPASGPYLGANLPPFAQQLADTLNATVWAPTALSDSYPPSDPIRWSVRSPGQLIPFCPGGRSSTNLVFPYKSN